MLTRTRDRTEAARRRPIVLDLLLALLVGLIAALAKKHLDWSIGIPGHAGVGWIAVLTTGALINPRRGFSTVAGASMAVWGSAIGLGHSLGYNAALYGLAGAVLDATVVLGVPIRRWWGAAAVGAAAHIAKYAFIFGNAWVSGIIRNFEIYGILAALRNHAAFGLAGGLVGWVVYRLWRRGARRWLPS